MQQDWFFLPGGGDMGLLIRAKDWTKTALGHQSGWPQSLRTALSIVMGSKFPMLLMWGPDLICIYNDAFRPSLGQEGKHPAMLGQRAEEAWTEIWSVIKPMFDQVLTGGESIWNEDLLIPIDRNGAVENVWWTFSYGPVNDESGGIAGIFVTCVEMTEKINNFRGLQASDQRFQNPIRESNIGIVVLSGKDILVEIVNEAYGRLIDRTPAELLKKPLFDFIPDAEQPFRQLLDNVRTTGEPVYLYDAPYMVHSKDRKIEGFLDVIYQPYKEADGSITGVMALVTDVTERVLSRKKVEEAEATARLAIESTILAQKQFAEELTKQVRERTIELQRSNDDLLQFAHVISHDLKEPVRKIKIFNNRLQDELGAHLPPKAQSYIGKVLNAADRMSEMIEGVLNYSSLSADAEAFEAVDLNDVLKNIITDLEIPIQQKSATINFNSLPRIEGAPILLYQLFYNLINNSLKFSRRGVSPDVTITADLMMEAGKDFAKLMVADNGIGFDQEHAGSIFHSFTRLHSKDSFEGTGLGLALCKKIVERHGGAISATGTINKGASIIITLPLVQTV